MACANIQSTKLVECLLSPEVQVPLPVASEEEEARLNPAEVVKVFTEQVPGVQKMLFRQQPGQCVLKFIQVAYKDGWSAFKGTPLDNHLKWLMRLIVHHGHEGKSGASQFLREVAEAFMDCQAVQGRVVERIGLQIRGVTTDFRGLVVALAGEYKSMALKMLAVERIMQGKAFDDATPTHYENRLTADLGHSLGLNADDVRRAELDQHARARFAKLRAHDVSAASERCRELFDLDAFAQVLVSEINSFSESSSPNSLPRQFLNWVSDNMAGKHVVFDQETFTHVEVDRILVLAVLEVVFLGQLETCADRLYQGAPLSEVFGKEQLTGPVEDDSESTTCSTLEDGSESSSLDTCSEADVTSASVVPTGSSAQQDEEGVAWVSAILAVLFSPSTWMERLREWMESLWSLSRFVFPVGA